MRRLFCTVSLAGALMLGSSDVAWSQGQIGLVVLKFSGERGWSAQCAVTKSNGRDDSLTRNGRGRQSSGSMTFRRIAGGSCTITVPENTNLKVDVSGGRTAVCPFGEQRPCSQRYPAGEHRFELVPTS